MQEGILPLQLLIIQGTPFCNIDCNYCYLPDRNKTDKVSIETIEEIYKNIFSSNIVLNKFTTVWHAGEPLILDIKFYENVLKVIEKLNTKNYIINHSLQTNGILINQEWCNFIKENPSIKISVSIDGPDFIHDKSRVLRNGKGTHKSVMKGIELLQKNDISFNTISVITKDTLEYPKEFFYFFVENGIKSIALNFEEIEGINKISSLSANEHRERINNFIKIVYKLSLNSPIFVREFNFLENAIFKGFKVENNQLVKPFAILNVDLLGNYSTFSPELLTVKNDLYEDFIIGNVYENLIIDSLKSEKFLRIYNDIKKGVEICKNECYYFALCGGGSPSNKLAENNTFVSSSTLACELRTKKIVDIILPALESNFLIE